MVRRLIEVWKAWRRGERRVAPEPVRGRVYARKAEAPGEIAAKTRPEAKLSARVYRAAEGAWYRQDATGNWEKE